MLTIQKPSEELNNALRASAKSRAFPLIEGTIHSSDVFYRDSGARPTYWEVLRDEKKAAWRLMRALRQ